MKCQFHFLYHVDDGSLQMYSDKIFKIDCHKFNFFFKYLYPSETQVSILEK